MVVIAIEDIASGSSQAIRASARAILDRGAASPREPGLPEREGVVNRCWHVFEASIYPRHNAYSTVFSRSLNSDRTLAKNGQLPANLLY